MQPMRHGISIGLLAIALSIAVAVSASAQQIGPATISTNATGSVKVVPDRALIELAVQTRAPTATSAARDNAEKQARVITAIRKLGVDASQIATQGYSVTPESRNDKDDQTPKIVSYLVSNTIVVDASNIDLVGKVLDDAIAAGANDVSSLSLYRQDTEAAYHDALAVAVEKAMSAAAAMATASGGRLGPLLNMSSSGAIWPSPMMKTARMTAFVDAETQVSAGEQSVSASVNATWVFLPGR